MTNAVERRPDVAGFERPWHVVFPGHVALVQGVGDPETEHGAAGGSQHNAPFRSPSPGGWRTRPSRTRWCATGANHKVEEFVMDFRPGGREVTRSRFQEGSPFRGVPVLKAPPMAARLEKRQG